MSIVQIVVIAVICLVATAPDGIVLPDNGAGLAVGRSTWRSSPAALALVAQTWAQAHLPPTRPRSS